MHPHGNYQFGEHIRSLDHVRGLVSRFPCPEAENHAALLPVTAGLIAVKWDDSHPRAEGLRSRLRGCDVSDSSSSDRDRIGFSGLDRRALRGPGQSGAGGVRRQGTRRPVDADDGRRQFSRLSGRNHGPRFDGPYAQAGPAVRRRNASGKPSSRSTSRSARSGCEPPTTPAATRRAARSATTRARPSSWPPAPRPDGSATKARSAATGSAPAPPATATSIAERKSPSSAGAIPRSKRPHSSHDSPPRSR